MVNEEGKPVGVISLTDIIAHITGLEQRLDELGGFYFQSFPGWDWSEQNWNQNLDVESVVSISQ